MATPAKDVAHNIREQLLARYAAGECVVDVDMARLPLKIGRVAAYKLASQGALAEGIPVLRLGRKYKVPLAALISALGIDASDQDEA